MCISDQPGCTLTSFWKAKIPIMWSVLVLHVEMYILSTNPFYSVTHDIKSSQRMSFEVWLMQAYIVPVVLNIFIMHCANY